MPINKIKEPIYIIIPVHNRKEITLQCIKTLDGNGDLDRYYAVVVDDGSTDGTSEAIAEKYPNVIILKGDGNLWWGGAIEKGMRYAYQQRAKYLLWLNDDCYPTTGAIEGLVNICKNSKNAEIVSAQCLDPDTQEASYGGLIIGKYTLKSIYTQHGNIIQCDALNGNLVCIPRAVVKTIGFPDSDRFPHHLTDYIYTYAAKKAGFNVLLSSQFIVFCKNDNPYKSWFLSQKPLFLLWQSYFDPKSVNYRKILISAYTELLGNFGIYYFLIHRVIKFWIVFIFVFLFSHKNRLKIKFFLTKIKTIFS